METGMLKATGLQAARNNMLTALRPEVLFWIKE
jgi:hypothetical protein